MGTVDTRSLSDIWTRVLENLPPHLAVTLRTSVLTDYLLDDSIRITANSNFLLERLSQDHELLQKKLREVSGRDLNIRLELDTSLRIPESADSSGNTAIDRQTPKNTTEPSYRLKPNPKWTFETFRHGPYNHLAYYTAQRFANWDSTCPPAFILAASGSGKTHLAHAIWQEARKNRPEANVACVPAKAFMEEYRRIARGEGPRAEKDKQNFWSKYREADLLIIDDVHRLCDVKNNWIKSRDAFRDILDHLKERGALIMVISVLPVNDLEKCEPELKSRLRGLAVIKLDPPDYQARVGILTRLIKDRGITLPEGQEDKLVGMILERLPYDMRELTEGAPAALENYFKTMGEAPIDEKAIRSIFGEQCTNPRLTMGIVQEVVARKFGMTVHDLRMKRVECPIPWTIAVYLCSTMLRASVQDIALTFQVEVSWVNATLKSVTKHHSGFFEEIGEIHEELASL